MGCSAHSVPSLSKVATRSTAGTKSGEPGFVTRSTKASIAFLDTVSFHDGSGSPVADACAVAETGRSVDKAGSAARAESSARRLTAEIGACEVIANPSQLDLSRVKDRPSIFDAVPP